MNARAESVMNFNEAWFWKQVEQSRDRRYTATGVQITPAFAEFLLTRNETNRKVYDEHVSRLAEDMLNGRWEENGETLKFSITGELNDGQHRLFASALNNVQFVTDITFGVTRASRLTVDQGKKRTAADIMTLRDGTPNARVAAGAIRMLLTLQAKNPDGTLRVGPKFTAIEVAAHSNEFPGLVDCVTRAKHLYTSIRRPSPSLVAAIMFLTDKVNMSASQVFWRKLETGLDMPSESDPIYLLRGRLQQLSYIKGKTMSDYDSAGLLIKAWNYHRQGKELKVLQFNSKNEKFPQPK